jgi:hypothetical protein
MTDLSLALDAAGLSQYNWGPDISTYETLAAGWPTGNPSLPSEAALEAALAEAVQAQQMQAIAVEAEQRIAAGILVDTKPFRCDEVSTQRVGEMVRSFADGLVGEDGVTFRTAAGDLFTLTSSNQAQAIYDAQRRWRSSVLEVSAKKQGGQSINWPDQISITLD